MMRNIESARRAGWVIALGVASALLAGCGHTQWNYSAMRDVDVSLPAVDPAQNPLDRAGTPAERLHTRAGGASTALVAVESHNNPDRIGSDWSRAFVVVLDGPPKKGKIVVTPENGRLVSSSERRPARRPYVGIEGYVNILSVEGNKVKTYCVLRNELIDAYDESVVLRGFYDFRVAAGNEPYLRSSGLAVGQ